MIAAGLFVDIQPDCRLAVYQGQLALFLNAVGHLGDLAEGYRASVPLGHSHLAVLIGTVRLTLDAQRIFGSATGYAPERSVGVFRFDPVDNVIDPHTEGIKPGRIDIHVDFPLLPADHVHFAHAGHALEAFLDLFLHQDRQFPWGKSG